MLFDRGSAVLNDQTKSALTQIAQVIRGHRNIVMVKGHTSLDDFPDGATEEQKMDLSIRRAQAAADYLAHHGVDPSILRVQGCSTYEPLTEHQYTPDAQELNRRVEVEATNTLVQRSAEPIQPRPGRANDASSARGGMCVLRSPRAATSGSATTPPPVVRSRR